MPSKSLFLVVPSVLVLALAGAAHTGCSGSSGTNVPDDAGNGSSSSSGSGGSSSGTASGSGSTGSSSSSGSGSGSSSGSTSGSSSGSNSSSGGSSSGSSDAGACPAAACGGSEVCCLELDAGKTACVPTCSSANTLQCGKPSDCSGGTPDCCATLVVNGGMFPSCHTQSLSTQCVASCTSNMSFMCQATDTLHVCAKKSDCAADIMNPDCCTVSGYTFCVSDQLATLGNLTCAP